MNKQALRRRFLRRLRSQPQRARQAKSRAIAGRLRRLEAYRQAKTLLCYVSFDGEVETLPILRKALSDGKRVAVPAIVPPSKRLLAVELRDVRRDLTASHFGIPHPRVTTRRVPLKSLKLVLVPGVAFDRRGRRLGRGGGYFDRFLQRLPRSARKIGLAFDFQIVEKDLPEEKHDIPMSGVVTNKEVTGK